MCIMKLMSDRVVQRALELLPGVGCIVDLYDMSFVWASEEVMKIFGYTKEEIMHIKCYETLDEKNQEQEWEKIMAERLEKGRGNTAVFVKNKAGKLMRLKMQYQIFGADGGMYMAAKEFEVEDVG